MTGLSQQGDLRPDGAGPGASELEDLYLLLS